MERKKLIAKYERLLFKYGEYDVWECDVAPRLEGMTTEGIRGQYEADRRYYEWREHMLQV